MSAGVSDHHHRPTTKAGHKPHKPRFTSKNALRDRSKGRTIDLIDRNRRRTSHQQVMSKLDRRNQAKQRRLAYSHAQKEVTSVFRGRDGAPRIVAVIPLCQDVSAGRAVEALNRSLGIEMEVPSEGCAFVEVERFKQRMEFVCVERDLLAAMDACKVADYVLLAVSAVQEVDAFGELILRSIEGQGIPNVYSAVQDLERTEPVKHRQQILNSLKSFMLHFFPTQEKIFSLDSRQECQNVLRSLCTTTPKGVNWRDSRSWMLVEHVEVPTVLPGASKNAVCGAILTGVVRGKPLKADRLMQVGSWGDFQIEQITQAPRPRHKKEIKPRGDAMGSYSEQPGTTMDTPTADQDTLDDLAPEEVIMDDLDEDAQSKVHSERKGVLLDDEQYVASKDQHSDTEIPKRLPRGTSKYQSAWYIDDVSDSGSDISDLEDTPQEDQVMDDFPDTNSVAQYPINDAAMSKSDIGSTHDTLPDPSTLDAYRAQKHTEATDHLKYPDEIELPPTTLARERLHKYRGLRNAKTSPWDTSYDALYQPPEWPRLLDISNYRSARNKTMHEALGGGGARPGTRVSVHLRDVPLVLLQTYDPKKPLGLFSLLRHERKRTALNVSFTLKSDWPDPVRSKEEMVVQYGHRRYIINPIFSTLGSTPNDVHKMERVVTPGRTVVASFTAPLLWGSVPALFFKRPTSDPDVMQTSGTEMQLLATGTMLPPSTTRITAKRALLTGQPYKIHARLVTVRYMFFDKGDVEYFRGLPLWTNRGRKGWIRESLGTHGEFKAEFGTQGKVGQQEAVGITLWKRVWPRPARELGFVEE